MDRPSDSTTTENMSDADVDDGLPPGDHALEIAARRGFGPLSPVARQVWHGEASPCVSCGQLVRRDADHCDDCGQDLRDPALEKMRFHAGPWFVLEHIRPFPGVSLERIIRQIHRGLITETSIVRGPSTDFQWRFAVETPGLCRYFGRCWHCHHEVTPSDTYCQACLSYLSYERPHSETRAERSLPDALGPIARATVRAPSDARGERIHPGPPSLPSSGELGRLAGAVRNLETIPSLPARDAPARIGPFRVSWIALGLLVLAGVALIVVARIRGGASSVPHPITPGCVLTGVPA